MQPLEEIAEKVGIERPKFRWLYTFLSSHVHALPLSLYRIGNDETERGRGLPSPVEESYTAIFLSLACTLLKDAGLELTELFKELKKPKLDDSEEPESVKTSEQPSNIGKTYVIDENDILQVTVFLESESKIITRYIYKENNNVVLEQHMEDENQFIVSLDPTFWRIDANGKPITLQYLDDYLNGNSLFSYQIDHVNFCIRIRTN